MLRKKYIFIDVKPTHKAVQSAFSTKQLITILHSLDKPLSLPERILGVKQTVSFELMATKENGIRYLVRVAKDDVSLIRKSLVAYLPGIGIKEVSDYVPANQSKQFFSLKEFQLKRSFVFPLQDQSLLKEHDPIAYITAQMTKLSKEELVALHIVATPVLPTTHRGITAFINTIKEKLMTDQDISNDLYKGLLNNLYYLLSKVFGSGKKKQISELSPTKKQLYQLVESKINEQLFEATVRLYITGETKQQTSQKVKGITSSFETFATSHQSLVLKRSIFSIIHTTVTDRIRYFLFKNRLLSFKNNPVFSVSELSSLYHLPYTTTTKTEDLLTVKSPMLPSPLPLKSSQHTLDLIFAHNTYGESTTPIGLMLEERRRHLYMIGATGTGKTTMLLQMIHQDMLHGKGIAVVDPHGDLVERLLTVIPKERIDDVIYVNPYDIEYPVGLNILQLPEGITGIEAQREKDLIASSIVSIFHKLYTTRYTGPRMEHILRNSVLTALELENPTLLDVYRLLTNKEFRKKAVAGLPKGVLKDFWNDEFGKLGSYQKAEQISPITNKLGKFLTTSITRNMLTQPNSKIDFEEILDGNKILLCDLSKGKIGEDTSSFLGSLLIAKIQLAALKRGLVKAEKRKDFFLYIDEFQNFATSSFAQILSEARKYRLNTILAHQTISQIEDKDLLKVILANVGSIISFRTSNPSDEDMILPIFAPEVEKHEIASLPLYHFYMKINAIESYNTFTGAVEDFAKHGNSQTKNLVIRHSRLKYRIQKMEKVKDNEPRAQSINHHQLSKAIA